MLVTKKLKVSEIVNMWATIYKLQNEKREFSTKFTYALVLVKGNIEHEIKAIEEIRKPSERFVEYDRKRLSLAHELSEKDENGNSKIVRSQQGQEDIVILSKKDEFNKRLNKLTKEYDFDIQEQMKKNDTVDSILNENRDIDLYTISIDDFPPTCSINDLESLKYLIEIK